MGEFDDDSDDSGEPGDPDPLLKESLSNRAPPSPEVVDLARSLVDRAHLKFKNFREDREQIENAAVQASREEGHISPRQARDIFMDKGDCVSLPLVRRYLDAREFELVAKYLRHRIMYQPTDWLTPRNRLALDGMIAGGEVAMAVALLREYLKKLHGAAQKVWRGAGRKPRPGMPAEMLPQFERMKADALAGLPGTLQIAELELAEIESYLAQHGSREDNRALGKFREEIGRVRKRFALDRESGG